MTDIMSQSDRSKHMSKVKTRNTNIEVKVRKWLFAHGFRYRINVKVLPGKPDIVLHKYKCVIFINGCFWHGHNCKDGHLPKSNVEFWEKKINENRLRDKRVNQSLFEQGWHVITIWKCQLKDFDNFMEQILKLITGYDSEI